MAVKRLTCILLVLVLLPPAAGCGRATEVEGTTPAATPTVAAPTPTSAELATAAMPTDTPVPQPTETLTPPPPTETPQPITSIEGTVMRVSLSAQAITLREPVQGFDVVGLTEGSEIVSAEGRDVALRDVPPGMTLQISGWPGDAGALLADRIRLLGGVERIQFEAGATAAGVSGRLDAQRSWRYVLRASAGQTMKVTVSPPTGEVLLGIWAADGTVLKRKTDGGPSWVGRLPAAQDYVIEVASAGEAVDYQLGVVVPVRIAFAAGETSAGVSGQLGPQEIDHYVLWAAAGQTMEVDVAEAEHQVGLTIVGEDGIPLKRYVDEQTSWRGELPATQRYFIEILTAQATDYELKVTVLPQSAGPSIEVLAPGPGERWVEGQTYEVVWRSTGVEAVDIALALGAKDKGLMARGVDAEVGRYTWTVPEGFVCGFGVAESSGRVMVFDSSDPTVSDENDGDFTFACPRIQFEPGVTSALVKARAGGWYALRAVAGQSLYVTVAPQDGVSLDVVGGATWLNSEGAPFAAMSSLPETRDYLIHPMADGDESLLLKVTADPVGVAPQTIQFDPGATLATVEGTLGGGGDHAGYTLLTSAGQMVAVEVEPRGWRGGIWLRGEDGAIWATGFGANSLTAKLPTAGETFIALLTPPGAEAVDYVLTVSVTP